MSERWFERMSVGGNAAAEIDRGVEKSRLTILTEGLVDNFEGKWERAGSSGLRSPVRSGGFEAEDFHCPGF
jgi:hypothetical protein